MKFYVLDSSHIAEEYVSVSDELKDISLICSASEFQHLTKEPRTVELKDASGKIWPDFINENGIPLISDKMKLFLVQNGVDYLFYKKIIFRRSKEEYVYWLALPERISCLNLDESVIDDLFGTVEHFAINEDKIGRYEIFKLKGVTNLEIIVTESLAEKIKSQKFTGVYLLNLR